IKVLDFGTTGGARPFMVMEYFDSESLETLLVREGKLAENVALDLFIHISDVLRCIHENGIYHRDLKPSNILIASAPTDASPIRLIDFGISKSTQDVQSNTQIQGRTVAGTPGYMSPDQVAGLPFDAVSEIYSLGCVMFETLTGSQPFKADSA